jgi:hypothetical protein
LSSPTYTIGSQITQPGSVYWYYGGATWAIVNYTVWYVDTNTGIVYYMGTTTVSEVLYVPPNDAYGNAYDYGNGTISMLYYGAIPVSRQYFGYPALNASTVVDYAAFIHTSTGQEYLYQCNGPVNVYSGGMYTITLGGVNTAYGLSSAELGTGLGGLALGITSMLTAPSTSTTITKTTLEFGGVTNSTSLYISVINATTVYGLPTFGLHTERHELLRKTQQQYTCKYGKITWIG